MSWKYAVLGAMVMTLAGAVSTVQAQTSESRFSVDFGLGINNGISGNINSGAIGNLNGQVTVVTKNTYDDVYGTGGNLSFGGGFMWKPDTEIKASFLFESLDADLTPMGDYGASNLYGQYSHYQTFALSVGLRRYTTVRPKIRIYGEGLIGVGFIDKIDVTLAAPGAGLSGKNNDFYDQTAAFTWGINGGALFQTNEHLGVFAQTGLRYITGMSGVDDLAGTGLDTINDNSARWAIPFVVGIRFQF